MDQDQAGEIAALREENRQLREAQDRFLVPVENAFRPFAVIVMATKSDAFQKSYGYRALLVSGRSPEEAIGVGLGEMKRRQPDFSFSEASVLEITQGALMNVGCWIDVTEPAAPRSSSSEPKAI